MAALPLYFEDTMGRKPRKCCWDTKRFCCGCGNWIVPREEAWVMNGDKNHYHTNCLIRFLYDAWQTNLNDHMSWIGMYIKQKFDAEMWKGNHDEVVRRFRKYRHSHGPTRGSKAKS
jgi:hypothetical protein